MQIRPDSIGEIAHFSGKIEAAKAARRSAGTLAADLTRQPRVGRSSGLALIVSVIHPRPAFRATPAQERPS